MVETTSKGRFVHSVVEAVWCGRVRGGRGRPGPAGSRHRARTSPWTGRKVPGKQACFCLLSILMFHKTFNSHLTRISHVSHRLSSNVVPEHHCKGELSIYCVHDWCCCTRIFLFSHRLSPNVVPQLHCKGGIEYLSCA